MEHIKEVIPSFLKDLYRKQCSKDGKEFSILEYERLTSNYYNRKKKNKRVYRLKPSQRDFINRVTD